MLKARNNIFCHSPCRYWIGKCVEHMKLLTIFQIFGLRKNALSVHNRMVFGDDFYLFHRSFIFNRITVLYCTWDMDIEPIYLLYLITRTSIFHMSSFQPNQIDAGQGIFKLRLFQLKRYPKWYRSIQVQLEHACLKPFTAK